MGRSPGCRGGAGILPNAHCLKRTTGVDSANMGTMKKSLLPSLLVLALMMVLAASACASSNKQKESIPTPSAESATTTATYEEDIDGVIRQLVFDYGRIREVEIDKKTYYSDSSGTEWIRFDMNVTEDNIGRAGPQPGPTGPVSGFMKKAPGENWELVNLGTGNVQCGAPADVQTGLGFALCTASERELDEAIEAYLLNGPGRGRKDTDVKISRKAYFVDSSGTNWVMFAILPIPNLTSSTYGIMKKDPEGGWEGVSFGSGGAECGLTADVQSGLGFAYCPHR